MHVEMGMVDYLTTLEPSLDIIIGVGVILEAERHHAGQPKILCACLRKVISRPKLCNQNKDITDNIRQGGHAWILRQHYT